MKRFSTLVLIALLSIFILKDEVKLSANPNDDFPVLVVPPAYTSLAGTAVFLGPFATTQRTYQLLIHENQLTALVGQYIDAITWRIPPSGSGSWPATDITYNNYDIYLSPSVPPANRSFTFSENIAGPQKQVRSGSLMITANSFQSGSNPNEFGQDITFDTAYLYTGGHLLIEIRHDGTTGTSRSIDAVSTSTSGYGTDFSACWQSNYAATTGLQGNFGITKINSVLVGITNNTQTPKIFELKQNYPNPFNPVTSIKYDIPQRSNVKISIFDISGKEIATLSNGIKDAGTYEIQWNAEGFTSGVYFYKLEADGFSEVRKMMLVK